MPPPIAPPLTASSAPSLFDTTPPVMPPTAPPTTAPPIAQPSHSRFLNDAQPETVSATIRPPAIKSSLRMGPLLERLGLASAGARVSENATGRKTKRLRASLSAHVGFVAASRYIGNTP